MRRLAAADPVRGVAPDRAVAEALLERVVSSQPHGAHDELAIARRRPRALVIVLVSLLLLAVAAGALAAVGAIRFGSPAPSSGSLSNPRQGLGALEPGTARVLPVAVPDPAGGPAWGIRVLSTTRGVGCIEVGRVLNGRLGVLGQDGAFGNDDRFHPLPASGLSNGGQCTNLDRDGLLFFTVSAAGVPASGWQGKGSCVATHPPFGLPTSQYCRPGELRDLYYGLLGPQASSVTYTLDRQQRTIKPVGPEGAYLIVAMHSRFQRFRGRRYSPAGTASSIMPHPWSSPITSMNYRNGTACRIRDTQPGTLNGQCTPPGYRPAPTPPLTAAQVTAPIHVQLIVAPNPARGLATRRAIRVSFTARVPVRKASTSYEIVEDTSTPEAAFEETERDINAGQTVSWLLPAPRPGVYSGKIVLGLGGAPPYPIYTYSPGPLVGRFSIRVP
jgi:hypothetical protein